MFTRRFFIAAVLLPLVLTVFVVVYARLALSVSFSHLGAILVPYASFCVILLVMATRCSVRLIRAYAYRVPLIFLLLQDAYLLLEFRTGVSVASHLSGLIGMLVVVSTYVLMFGYLYLLLMEQGYIWYLFHKRQNGAHSNILG